MKTFRQLKMTLFIGIVATVLISIHSGSQVAWKIYPAAVSSALVLLYWNAKRHLSDLQFDVAVAGRSLLAIGNMALGMGLVLMGSLAFREFGQLGDLSTHSWQSLGLIAAPLLEGAATSTFASFLWDDLHSLAALQRPGTVAAGGGAPSGPVSGGIPINVAQLQQQIDTFAKAVKAVAGEAQQVQTQLTTLTTVAKDYQNALKTQSETNAEQFKKINDLVSALRTMVANFQAFVVPVN